MDASEIEAAIGRVPFLPVRVRLAGGAEYRLTLPDQIRLFGPHARRCLMLGELQLIPLTNVVSVDVEEEPVSYVVAQNGVRSPTMTTEKFDEFLKRRPFVPFTVHVADGGSFEVRGPEFASRTQNGRTIFVSTGGEQTEWIDLLMVTRISSGVNNPSSSAK